MSAIPALRFHHVSLLVADTARALIFYQQILGLPLLDRPPLGFAGAWLALGCGDLHLLELPNPDAMADRPPHAGRDRHLALATNDLDALIIRLDHHAIPYTFSLSGRRALFCRDPDGNGVEIVEVTG
jgi:glyoxylase I family protein